MAEISTSDCFEKCLECCYNHQVNVYLWLKELIKSSAMKRNKYTTETVRLPVLVLISGLPASYLFSLFARERK